jgi:hypothetical protein
MNRFKVKPFLKVKIYLKNILKYWSTKLKLFILFTVR